MTMQSKVTQLHGLRWQWHGRVALVHLARPDRRNALDLGTLQSLETVQRDARDAGAVMLAGDGTVFCAGADLSGVGEDEFHGALNTVLRGFTKMPCPVLAFAHGAALGAGTQLLVASDLRMTTHECVTGIPAAKLGLVVHHWTVERLARELSWPVARAMLLAAQSYTGEQLHRIGAVHRLGTFDDALAWATELCDLAPLTLAGHKVSLEALAGEPSVDELVIAARAAALASADAIEGRKAFAEKRSPKFLGS
jgi:enoyl-CoA hydratase